MPVPSRQYQPGRLKVSDYDWVDAPDFQDWLNDLMENSPACCWDQDEAMTEIARRYVRHLETEVTRLGGSLHQRWCDTTCICGELPSPVCPAHEEPPRRPGWSLHENDCPRSDGVSDLVCECRRTES